MASSSGQSRKRPRGEGAVTQVEESSSEFRPKKLRIPHREHRIIQKLDEAVSGENESRTLEILREIKTNFLPDVKSTEAKSLCERLLLILKSRNEEEIRQTAAAVLKSVFLRSPRLLAAFEVDIIFQNLKQLSEDTELTPAVLYLWRQLIEGRHITPETEHFSFIQSSANQFTFSSNFGARKEALKLILACALKNPPKDRKALEESITACASDQDPRVRAVAVKILLELSRSWDLGMDVYKKLLFLLNETCDAVRWTCLELMQHFALTRPKEEVEGPSPEVKLKLVDDVFSHICNAMHDPSVHVRAEAAGLLGSLEGVSESFLQQTLDKKLMATNQFTRKKFRRDFLQEWATGRKFGADAPVEKSDEETKALIPSGACGAFIVGLEDEYMVVRRACVKSLGALAKNRPSFAAFALDFLTDMFNDEIEEVRLDSIMALKPLIQYSQLEQAQMETILNVLDDIMADSREGLRQLLNSCRLSNIPSVKMTILALLNNLTRYSGDKDSIYECLRNLGLNHAGMVLPLVQELLELHPFFDSPEPHIENTHYIAKLVLIFNAASKAPPIMALFPQHTWRHHHFLRDSRPDLVPQLKMEDQIRERQWEESGNQEEDGFFRYLNIQLSQAVQLCRSNKDSLARLFKRDLQSFFATDHISAPLAHFLYDSTALLLRCEKAISAQFEEGGDDVSWGTLWKQLSMIDSFFVCRDSKAEAFLLETRVALAALGLVSFEKNPLILLKLLSETLNKALDSKNMSVSNRVRDIANLVETHSSVDHLKTQVLERLRNWQLDLPILSNAGGIAKKTARVLEPRSDEENVLKFVAGLVTSANFVAELHNFSADDLPSLRIRVCYPNQEEFLHRPRPSDFRSVGAGITRLSTKILLSAYVWNDVGSVELELVFQPMGMRIVEKLDKGTVKNYLRVDTSGGVRFESSGAKKEAQDIPVVRIHPKIRC